MPRRQLAAVRHRLPRSDGTPAPILELRTSWRNPPRILQVATPCRRRRGVDRSRCEPAARAAPSGTVRVALLPDVQTEREWIADHLHHRYQRCRAEGIAPPTAAVLVRRNADAAPMAEALRAAACRWRWWAGGLLSVPEVADLVAMLRLVADPTAGQRRCGC
ncbi:putative ATP-dependent DNA helicase domain protein [Mycobacterium xenopi 4042]|uniref:Putative ATP-dependent DNA helicase domain protein n=1 Tax=Mycobacterium xenopi 4042 TaxID=1299334 RepID=X7YIZ1_MYCXE|nr:putative ATP-dependent DNA helicase domain protein [Mycobacterium xenopi 4042]